MHNVIKKITNHKVVLLAVLIVLTTSCAGLLAYLTSMDSERNNFNVGGVNVEVVEEFDPPKEITPGISFTKNVQVKNNGPSDCYVRIRAEFTNSDMGDNCIIDWNTTDYVLGDDGYYYYTDILPVDELSDSLFTTVTVSDSISQSEIKDFDILVYTEAYQAEGFDTYEKAWAHFERNKPTN